MHNEVWGCAEIFPLLVVGNNNQIILILKIIASYYEKFTPDCFVNLNV